MAYQSVSAYPQPFHYTPLQMPPELQALLASRTQQTQQVQTPAQGVDVSNLMDVLGPKSSSAPSSGWLTNLLKGGSSSPVATPEANAGWNAAAMESGGAPMTLAEQGPLTSAGGGLFDLSGIGGAGNAILPAAGAVGAYDLFKNQRTGKRGYLQGAASGAAMGSYFGPWGTAIGAGLGLAGAGANELFDTNRFKKEGNKLAKLQKQGYDVSQGSEAMGLRQGRTKDQLIAIEKAKEAAGQPSNVKFASSRNEGDLTGQDLQGYASIIEKAGKGASLADRIALGQKALNAGAVREHHGTIDVDWNKVGDLAQAQPAIAVGSPINQWSSNMQNPTIPRASQPTTPDAGTLKRWRLMRGQAGYSGR